jgi:hypothetical protein
MTIASSGSVGIGVSNPSDYYTNFNNLVLGSTSTHSGMTIASGTAHDGTIAFADGTSGTAEYQGYLQYNHGSNSLTFGTAATNRMVIDASGNVLVGTSVSGVGVGNTSTGHNINANGALLASRTTTGGTSVAYLNRNSSDGAIAQFQKDGTAVGSIGSAYSGSRLAIGKDGHGLGFVPTSAAIIPHSMTTNQNSNGTTDLGTDGVAFRDLYLSGGVVFGATGGSVTSKKLDDYEEGIWTPSLPNGGTLTSNTAYYTKIGRQVHLQFYISVINATAATTAFRIGGLPFTSLAGSTYPAGTISYCADGDLSGVGLLSAQATDYLYFHYIDGTNGLHVTNNEMRALFGTANSGAIIASITYLTAA